MKILYVVKLAKHTNNETFAKKRKLFLLTKWQQVYDLHQQIYFKIGKIEVNKTNKLIHTIYFVYIVVVFC